MDDPNFWVMHILMSVVLFILVSVIFQRFSSLGIKRPDVVHLRQTFQLDDPERFRKYVPDAILRNRKRRLFRSIAILLGIALVSVLLFVGFEELRSKTYDQVLFAVFWIVSLSQIAGMWLVRRKRRVLYTLGPNQSFVENAINSAGYQHAAVRWFFAVTLVLGFVRFWLPESPSFTGLTAMFSCMFLCGIGYSSEVQVLPTGVSNVATFTSWNEIVTYHWYPERQGVLIVRETWPYPPLTILPVPPDKSDEVERLLNEYLPGKRGEDVDVVQNTSTPAEQAVSSH